ncbi:MAG TPA: LysR substrate-binding domain-containing protein [Gemmatimonadaceae bacterium]|nr:LysR substrate-binding domain-containing protein [Gemmatimonadaceae bacterium]
MALNLHHLRLFAAVVDHGGFTRAAEALNLSQPAISKSLKELEAGLGLSLIDREGRSLRLTDAGRALHSRARELFGVERVAERELRELRGLKRGALRIAASTTIATYLLPPVLGRFHLRHPRVRIQTSSANTRAVLRLLLEARVDLALVEGPVSDAGVIAHPWRDDELVVIAPRDHRLLSERRVTVEDVAAERMLVREPGSGTREVSESALARHGIRLTRTMRVGGTEAIKQAVAAGLGLAIVSRAAAADQLALGRIAVLHVEGLTIKRTLTRLELRDRTATVAAREMVELLYEDNGNADASGVG